eukprot:Nk52_evm27s2630 gene=Nk52_evmTU27s2630
MVNAPKGSHSKGLENLGRFVGGKSKKFLTHKDARANTKKALVIKGYKKILKKEGYSPEAKRGPSNRKVGVMGREMEKGEGQEKDVSWESGDKKKKKKKAPHAFVKIRKHFKEEQNEANRKREEKELVRREYEVKRDKMEKERARKLALHSQKTKTGQPNLNNQIKLILENLQQKV